MGCPKDGQAGPLEAPKGNARTVRIDTDAAHKLAYYADSESGPGVLAPRGWHCFGIYGSSGGELYVSPQPLGRNDFFSTTWDGIKGPVVELEATEGGGSGTATVAGVIARVFPAHWLLVKGLIANGDLQASDYQFGPYPHDKIVGETDALVQFETAPHSRGLGTTAWVTEGDEPIEGVAILDPKTYDLVMLRVRLPRKLRDLAQVVIHDLLVRQGRDAR